MDSFEFNKIAGGLLGTLLGTMALGIVSDALFYRPAPAMPGYDLPKAPEQTAAAAPAVAAVPLPVLLAKEDAKKGETDARACTVCHNFEKGAGAKIGPPLYGVVGRPVASVPGYAYSDTLKKVGGNWTFDELNHWITDPKAMASNTKMTYPGEPDPDKRAAIIDYLDSLSDTPVPLPAVAQGAAPAAAPAAASAGTQAAPSGAAPSGAAPAAPASAPATTAPAAPSPAATAAPAAGSEPPTSAALSELLAKADPKKGENDAKLCGICHNFEKDAGSKIGPPLYGVVGRPVASVPNFSYSDSLKKVGGNWTFDKIDHWITNPSAMASNTKMTFPGETDPAKRADIIAYLDTLSDNPVPLPTAQPGAAPVAPPAPK